MLLILRQVPNLSIIISPLKTKNVYCSPNLLSAICVKLCFLVNGLSVADLLCLSQWGGCLCGSLGDRWNRRLMHNSGGSAMPLRTLAMFTQFLWLPDPLTPRMENDYKTGMNPTLCSHRNQVLGFK
jgi:hypothetical protein